MRITIAVVGRLKAGPERDLFLRYKERFVALARNLQIDDLQVLEFAESPNRRTEDRMEDEARALMKEIPEGAFIVLLDEHGKSINSSDFAAILAEQRNIPRSHLVFIIGGPDGLSQKLREKSARLISFGAMTMPHQIVRGLLMEQLYRAATILSGHPYHRV